MNKKEIDNIGLAPFACSYSPQIPELLLHLGCSIALSTYQAGKLIFLSPKDENTLVQLPRTFEQLMGIALGKDNKKMALATKYEITVFANSAKLAYHYPKSPGKYDALFMPRLSYHTGPLDIHDLSYGADGELYAVNTLFSCIVRLSDEYNFLPFWMPPFISRLSSEDRCHLNGMTLLNGKPKYASAFNMGDSAQSWREDLLESGVLMDIENNEVLVSGLAMPHSPRIFDGELYLLLSATGELIKVDTVSGKYDVVLKLQGFVRGMSLYKDYLFIGLSKLRKNSSTFAKLPFAVNAGEAGIVVVHLPTASIAGKISYHNSLDEIYDIQILPGILRPNILNTRTPDHQAGISTPDTSFWAKVPNIDNN